MIDKLLSTVFIRVYIAPPLFDLIKRCKILQATFIHQNNTKT